MSAGPVGDDDGRFAARLRQFREQRTLTQEELAERARISAKAVGALERGERRRPHPHTVRALADALELDERERAELASAVPRRPGREPRAPAEPPVSSSEPTRHAFPAPTTELVGRSSEAAAIVAALTRPGSRMITLTGPGGVGKTRLALEVASRLDGALPGGCVVVELDTLRDPSLVVRRIAQALGMPEVPRGDVVAALAAFVAGRRQLVVLDNVEHLLACAADVADLLARGPDLLVLATSRAPLRIRAEQEIAVPPLALPDAGAPQTVEIVGRAPAVVMFLERTAAAGSALALTDENAATIAAICRALDGLPLALELAAAASRLLTPNALLTRLNEALGVGGIRDLPPRQQTLRETIEWSDDLLQEDERRLFARLAVFSGGFSLDAVEAIAPGAAVVAQLGALVEQSLVARVPSPNDEPRFRLLEPVRQYAAEKLHATAQAMATADRHADHYARVARDARPRLRGNALAACLDEFEVEHANLRSALLRLIETNRLDDAAAMAWDLWVPVALRGRAREGLTWIEPLLASALADHARSRAFGAAAGLLYVSGDIARMRGLADEAFRLADDGVEDDVAAEIGVLAGSAAIFASDLAAARPAVDAAFARAEAAGAEWAAAHAVVAQGQIALLQADLASADRLLADAEARARRVGNAFTLATTLNVRATGSALAGDWRATATRLVEAVHVSVDARISWTLGYSLPALAGLALGLGEPELAAQLFGAAALLSTTHSVDPRFPASSGLAEQDVAALQRELGDLEFRSAWEAGRRMTLDEIAEHADRLSGRASDERSGGTGGRRSSA